MIGEEIGEDPTCTIQPVRERLVMGQAAQSESHQPVTCNSGSADKMIP